MKRILVFLCAVALVFGMVGFASAAPMEWEDCIEFGPTLISATEYNISNPYSYYHDLGSDGFNPLLGGGSDVVTDYTLYVTLNDDGSDSPERGWVWQLGLSHSMFERYEGGFDIPELEATLLGIADINHDGTLNVWIAATRGDFNLIKSRLVGSGYGRGNETAPVPEPSTMLLLGVGLLGLVGYGRKRFNQKH